MSTKHMSTTKNICQQKQKRIVNDARSYKGTSVNSDHRLLVSRIYIEFYEIYKSNNKLNCKQFNCAILVLDSNRHKGYDIKLTEKLQNINEETNWNVIKDCIFKTAEDTIGYSKIHQSNRPHNVDIEQLSKEQE